MKHAVLVLFLAGAVPFSDAEESHRLSSELQAYLRRPEAQCSVLDGALLICKHAHPQLDAEAERTAISEMAADLKKSLAPPGSPGQQADALARLLYDKQHFELPEKDDEGAFLLSDVLHNRRGNCLGLSVLCLALAETAGLKLYGVPVPSRTSEAGHMFVRFDDGKSRRNFDAVEKGAEHPDAHYRTVFKLTEDDLRSGYVLGNAKKREVLALLLANLGAAWTEENRPAEAVPLLQAALAIRPESAAVHSNLAGAFLNLGQLQPAEKAYAAALRIDPKFFPARIGMAGMAFRRGDPKAAAQIDELVTLEPENVQARTLQASLQLQRNDLAGALKTLNDLSALPTADVSVWNNLGKCYALSGDMTLSEVAYRRALVFDDTNADAHCGLGRALAAAGKKKEALVEFDTALKLDPEHSAAKAGRAEALGQAAAAAERKAIVYPKGTSVIPFKLVSERIFVTVRLNDKIDVEAIVDTGTEVSILNSARVKVDGLRPAGAENLYGDMVGRLAVQMVTCDTLKLGDNVLRNPAIGRIEQGPGTKFEHVDFVVGMDILSKLRFTLDFTQPALVLWPAGSRIPPAEKSVQRTTIPLERSPDLSKMRPFVAGIVNKKHTATFLIDTAADAPMFVAFKKPAEMGFAVTPGGFTGVLHVNDGVSKQELPVHPVVFDTLTLEKTEFARVDGRVIDASGLNGIQARKDLSFLNVIGTPFLRTFAAVHFDMAGRSVMLDRAK